MNDFINLAVHFKPYDFVLFCFDFLKEQNPRFINFINVLFKTHFGYD